MRLDLHTMAGFNYLTGPFVLDLRSLPGLVAITGPNGAGKTSVALDGPMAGLYGPGTPRRAFPSREGPLAQYATTRDAYIDDVWTMADGARYRLRVQVDAARRTTEAVLLQIQPDGTEVALNDGKTSTFRDAVAARFPSSRSLLASAFAGQTRRGSFGELGEKERMELFVELADLAYLEDYASTARQAQAIAESHESRLQAEYTAMERTASVPRDLIVLRHDTVATRIAAIDLEQEQLDGQRASIVTARDQAQADATRHAAARAELAGIEQAIGAATREMSTLDEVGAQRDRDVAVAATDRRLTHALQTIATSRQTAASQYARQTADLSERIAANAMLLDRVDAITDAVKQTAAAEATIAEMRRAAEKTARDVRVADKQQADVMKERARLDLAEQQLAEAQRRAALIGSVKFGDACATDPICPLVTDAVAARGQIEALTAKQADRDRLGGQQASLDAWFEALRGDEVAQLATRTLAEATIRKFATLVQQQPYVAAAESRIKEYRADIAGLETRHLAYLAALEAEEGAAHVTADEERRQADATYQTGQAARAARLVALQAEIDRQRGLSLSAATAVEATALAAAGLVDLSRRLDAVQAQAVRLTAERATLDRDREGLVERLAECDRLTAQLAATKTAHLAVQNERLAWSTLARACGRDGLQRLEIDAAGPVVSDLANELLAVGYGTRFAVQVVTQVATADKKDTKERFTIEVLDNAQGGEPRDLGDLSGGERVVVEEAIRAALACYVNLRNRQPVRTIFRDETTGALAPENIEPYVLMLRKLRDLSGAEQVLFITHSPAAAALADVVVCVDDGRVTEIRRAA